MIKNLVEFGVTATLVVGCGAPKPPQTDTLTPEPSRGAPTQTFEPSGTLRLRSLTPSSSDQNPTPTIIIESPSFKPTHEPTSLPPKPKNSPPATQEATSDSEKLPSEILDLTNWKLTLPIGQEEDPTEILQPELKEFKREPWFVALNDGVRFRAAVNGVSTSGSGYPRSELREMTNGGREKAAWSSTSGTHSMFIDEAITHVPDGKKHIVAGQIHGQDDDIIVVRLEGNELFIDQNGDNVATLDDNYELGKRFTVKFVVEGGKTKIYFNGSENPTYTYDKDYSGAYFKAGAYTQSNCEKEKGKGAACTDDNYGEVEIFALTVEHS